MRLEASICCTNRSKKLVEDLEKRDGVLYTGAGEVDVGDVVAEFGVVLPNANAAFKSAVKALSLEEDGNNERRNLFIRERFRRITVKWAPERTPCWKSDIVKSSSIGVEEGGSELDEQITTEEPELGDEGARDKFEIFGFCAIPTVVNRRDSDSIRSLKMIEGWGQTIVCRVRPICSSLIPN